MMRKGGAQKNISIVNVNEYNALNVKSRKCE